MRIKVAGVNFFDVQQRRGNYPRPSPFTPGVEASGIVESVGEGVTGFRPSSRVAWAMAPGAYAEAAIVDAAKLIPLPDDFSFEQGAAFSGARHYRALFAARIPQDQAWRRGLDSCRGRRIGTARGAVGQGLGRARDRHGVDGRKSAHGARSGRGRRHHLYAAGFRRRDHEAHRRAWRRSGSR